jgi:hypothetical protein
MNKYLEKLASSDHIMKGVISPAWQQEAIAREYGKTLDYPVKTEIKGRARSVGRGLLEGGVAGVGTTAAGLALVKPTLDRVSRSKTKATDAYVRSIRRIAPSPRKTMAEAVKVHAIHNKVFDNIARRVFGAAALAGTAGAIHGAYASLKNQAQEAHNEYSK